MDISRKDCIKYLEYHLEYKSSETLGAKNLEYKNKKIKIPRHLSLNLNLYEISALKRFEIFDSMDSVA